MAFSLVIVADDLIYSTFYVGLIFYLDMTGMELLPAMEAPGPWGFCTDLVDWWCSSCAL